METLNNRCRAQDCLRNRKTGGFCGMHYLRWKRHGSAEWEPPRVHPVRQFRLDLLSREEIIWAGGLFEGEGCFTHHHQYPRAILVMTDMDSVDRFAAAVGFGTRFPGHQRPNRKAQYGWRVDGFEPVQALAAMFWPWLGARRQRTAVHVLRVYLEYPLTINRMGSQIGPCERDGCSKPKYCRNMCSMHYSRERRGIGAAEREA